MLWKVAREFAEEAVEVIDFATLWEEHEGALAGNDADPALAAEVAGLVAGGTLTTAAIHPDTAYSGFGAVEHDGPGDLGSSQKYGHVDRRFDASHARETFVAHCLGKFGMYRDNVVAAAR
jgi:hypothetical protein